MSISPHAGLFVLLALEGGDPDAAQTEEKVLGPREIESDERF